MVVLIRNSIRVSLPFAVAALVAMSVTAFADKPKKPSMNLRVSPRMAFSPVNILAIAELSGGDDHEDYYCLGVEWDWGDGSKSIHDADCDPYQEGAKIERRFSAEHMYSRSGAFNVKARLIAGSKVVAASSYRLTVRPGLPRGNGIQ